MTPFTVVVLDILVEHSLEVAATSDDREGCH
jgi:hypothetical protein